MKLILKNIFTNRNTCYYLWFALPRANKLKNDKRKKEIFRWIFLGGLLLFVTFPVFTQ